MESALQIALWISAIVLIVLIAYFIYLSTRVRSRETFEASYTNDGSIWANTPECKHAKTGYIFRNELLLNNQSDNTNNSCSVNGSMLGLLKDAATCSVSSDLPEVNWKNPLSSQNCMASKICTDVLDTTKGVMASGQTNWNTPSCVLTFKDNVTADQLNKFENSLFVGVSGFLSANVVQGLNQQISTLNGTVQSQSESLRVLGSSNEVLSSNITALNTSNGKLTKSLGVCNVGLSNFTQSNADCEAQLLLEEASNVSFTGQLEKGNATIVDLRGQLEEIERKRKASMANVRVGRYVKLQASKEDYMNISEVQVFDSAGTDVARGKPVTMSSIYNNSQYGPGANLVDGYSGTFAHTNNDMGWIQIDLGSNIQLSKITVRNRQDCCQDRLIGTVVLIFDASNNKIFESQPLTNAMTQDIVIK